MRGIKYIILAYLPIVIFLVLDNIEKGTYAPLFLEIPLLIVCVCAIYYMHQDEGKIKYGCTRVVWIIGKYAFKFPRLDKWEHFLQGLLGNLQERMFARSINLEGKLCPVYFSIWGGLCNVMPKCEPVKESDFYVDWDFHEWSGASIVENNSYIVTIGGLPVEKKLSSFGKLNGKIVAVDFGTWDRIHYKEKNNTYCPVCELYVDNLCEKPLFCKHNEVDHGPRK